MKTTASDIANIAIAINNLNQVRGDKKITRNTLGQIIQLQNELDIKLEIMRLATKAPKQPKCA